jgi:hypothetical protein
MLNDISATHGKAKMIAGIIASSFDLIASSSA